MLRPTEYAAQLSPVTNAPVAIIGSIGTEATAARVMPVAARPPTDETVSEIGIEMKSSFFERNKKDFQIIIYVPAVAASLLAVVALFDGNTSS